MLSFYLFLQKADERWGYFLCMQLVRTHQLICKLDIELLRSPLDPENASP